MGHLGGLEGLPEGLGDHLGSLEGRLGDLEGHLGAKRAAKGQNLDFLIFHCFCDHVWSELGDNRLGLWAILRVWRAILGGLGDHLGGLEGHFWRSGGSSWRS